MTNHHQPDELERLRSQGQELAVAWGKGRAAYVLDTLGAEEPLRAALIATFVLETLTRWDPYDSKWPSSLRTALHVRSQGKITDEELAELEREYSRVFGSSPPPPPPGLEASPPESVSRTRLHVARIRSALDTGRPLIRERRSEGPAKFLRFQPVRRHA